MYMTVSHHVLYPILCHVFIYLNKIQYEINGSLCISSRITMYYPTIAAATISYLLSSIPGLCPNNETFGEIH